MHQRLRFNKSAAVVGGLAVVEFGERQQAAVLMMVSSHTRCCAELSIAARVDRLHRACDGLSIPQ